MFCVLPTILSYDTLLIFTMHLKPPSISKATIYRH